MPGGRANPRNAQAKSGGQKPMQLKNRGRQEPFVYGSDKMTPKQAKVIKSLGSPKKTGSRSTAGSRKVK